MYSQDELREIYRRLSEPFPEEAIERTKGRVTGRGYDTSGVKVQYVINRLNGVLGLGGFRVEPDITVRERPARNGRTVFEAVCDITMQLGRWEDGSFVAFAEAPATGGHVAALEADARKGALSNAIKKAAAAFGVAWQAFAGRLDEDNSPAEHDDWRAEGSEDSKPVQRGEQRSQENGRITSSQLSKMRELVDEIGGDWARFREHVRKERKVNVEYANKRVASEIIADLIAMNRERRSNGRSAPGRQQ